MTGAQVRGQCAVCDRTVALIVPTGGDGTRRLPRRHKDRAGGDWCRGQWEPAKGWE